jgi:adenylosuccinate synthase
MIADVVLGLQYGDEGKGKITHHLCKTGGYTHVVRFNGGCNAGHTIFHKGKKFVTHHIPAGVFFGIKSIIGPGCVVSPTQFFKELEELKEGGVDTKGLVYIAENTHVITEEHLEEDDKDTAIGTTKRGNGPAYREKYARNGFLAKDIPYLQPYLVNFYDELHKNTDNPIILCEGAQGFGLDIDWGDYPFVTSSHCTVGSAVLNGIPPKAIRDVWGVAKAYETYVGAKKFELDNPVFSEIRKLGNEYGATTARPRQCGWLDWKLLEKSININGVNKIVFNKIDILEKLNQWVIKTRPDLYETFHFRDHFQQWIEHKLKKAGVEEIYFSGSPYKI